MTYIKRARLTKRETRVLNEIIDSTYPHLDTEIKESIILSIKVAKKAFKDPIIY